MISVTCIGHAALASKFLAAIPAARVASGAGLAKAGLLVLRRAKQNVVAKDIIDTGNLFNSIVFGEVSPSAVEVVSGAEYSIYNEFGTVKMAARPYMRPALDESKAQIEKLIGQPVIIALHEVIGG